MLVSDAVARALRLCGVRNVSDSQRIAEGMNALNLMLKSWGEHMLIPTKESFTLTVDTYEYTIGDGADFDTTRPMSILSAYIEDSSGYDYEVDVSMSPIDYDKITDKDYSTRPEKLYYAAEFNSQYGKIYFDSAPDTAETFYLTSFKGYTEYTSTSDVLVQPPEYEKAIIYNLAIDLAPEYSVQLMQTVINQAIMLKDEISKKIYKVPMSKIDGELLR